MTDLPLPPLSAELLHRLDLSTGGNGFAMAAAIDVVEAYALAYGRMAQERCAEICEEKGQNSAVAFGYRHGAEQCAAAIRANAAHIPKSEKAVPKFQK